MRGSRVVWSLHDESRYLGIEMFRGCSAGYEDHCVRELLGEGVAVCLSCDMGRFWCGGLRFGWVVVWGSWALRWVLCGGCRVVVGLWGGCSVGRMRCEGVAVGELRYGRVAVRRSDCGELQCA